MTTGGGANQPVISRGTSFSKIKQTYNFSVYKWSKGRTVQRLILQVGRAGGGAGDGYKWVEQREGPGRWVGQGRGRGWLQVDGAEGGARQVGGAGEGPGMAAGGWSRGRGRGWLQVGGAGEGPGMATSGWSRGRGQGWLQVGGAGEGPGMATSDRGRGRGRGRLTTHHPSFPQFDFQSQSLSSIQHGTRTKKLEFSDIKDFQSEVRETPSPCDMPTD